MLRNFLTFAVALAFGAPAFSATIIVNSSSGIIAELDTTTGNLSNSFDAGAAFFDIALDDTGTGYGVTSTGVLYSIDFSANTSSLIGGTGFIQAGLAYEFSGLFGSGGGNLFSINTTTGATTIVGAGVGGNFLSSGDLAFAGANLFYATSANSCGGTGDCLWTIDATTGVGTVIGATGFSSLVGLALVEGELFAMSAFDNKLYKLDTSTGAGTFLTSYDFGTDITFGAAVAPSSVAPPAVPVPPTLPLLGVSVLALGLVRRSMRA